MLASFGYQSLEKSKENLLFPENEIVNIFVQCKGKYGFSIDLTHILNTCTELNILEKQNAQYRFAHSIYQKHFHSLQEEIILG